MFLEQNFTIEQLPLSDKNSKRKVVDFCAENGLTFDEGLEYYCGIFSDSGEMVAGGGFDGSVIKCIAVSGAARDTGLTNKLVSHLRSEMQFRGAQNIFVFTKLQYAPLFESLAFFTVGEAQNAVLLESDRRGIKNFCDGLDEFKTKGENGAIVMNANPFTLGHRFLAETAKSRCDTLFVFVVEENRSFVSFEDRLRLVKQGLADMKDVVVLPSGKYIVSTTTFPTYFLKEQQVIDQNCAQLDADIFGRHIAKRLNIRRRFVGTEPTDIVTADYNRQLKTVLDKYGVELVEVNRLCLKNQTVSATTVRKFLINGDFDGAKDFLPNSSFELLKDKYCVNADKKTTDS